MALTFNQSKGEAQKSKVKSYTYVDGDNQVRLVEIYAQDMFTG